MVWKSDGPCFMSLWIVKILSIDIYSGFVSIFFTKQKISPILLHITWTVLGSSCGSQFSFPFIYLCTLFCVSFFIILLSLMCYSHFIINILYFSLQPFIRRGSTLGELFTDPLHPGCGRVDEKILFHISCLFELQSHCALVHIQGDILTFSPIINPLSTNVVIDNINSGSGGLCLWTSPFSFHSFFILFVLFITFQNPVVPCLTF